MRVTQHLPRSFIMECMNVLPAGFRFHPTDEELISDYLKKKISASSNPFVSIISEIDLYKFDPWQLPGKAYFGDKEWYFFSPRDRKYQNGARPNRIAASGFWKATGTDKPIISRSSQCIGVKKALVFYEGRAPTGNKTDWMMYEYRLIDNVNHYSMMHGGSMRLDEWVICRIQQKKVPPEPKPQDPMKKKAKRAHDNTFKIFIEDEFCKNNISFRQPNESQPQHLYDATDLGTILYEASDLGTVLDFTENSSSLSHSISYDNYDCQMNANGWRNEAIEGIKRGILGECVQNQPDKKLCNIDSSAFLNSNPLILHQLPV